MAYRLTTKSIGTSMAEWVDALVLRAEAVTSLRCNYVGFKSSPEVVVGQLPNDVRLTDAHRE